MTTTYRVGHLSVPAAPDVMTPDAAVVDARNILASARWQAVDGPEAIWQFLNHAVKCFDAIIEAQLRAPVARAEDPEVRCNWPEVRCNWCDFYLHPCRPADDPVCRLEEYAAKRRQERPA